MVVVCISNEGNGGSLENGYLTQFFDFGVRSFDELCPSFHLTSGKKSLNDKPWSRKAPKVWQEKFLISKPFKKGHVTIMPAPIAPSKPFPHWGFPHYPCASFRQNVLVKFRNQLPVVSALCFMGASCRGGCVTPEVRHYAGITFVKLRLLVGVHFCRQFTFM